MNINFKKLLLLLIPSFLRKSKVLKAFLNAFAIPFQKINKKNDDCFREINYFLCITPQVCCLERLLNDKCDPLLRRISIIEPAIALPFYFTGNDDSGMYYFDDDEHFSNRGNYIYDFIVQVPADVPSSDTYISALLNKYKLPSKTFQIVRI